MPSSQLRPTRLASIDDTEDWSLYPFYRSQLLDDLRTSINKAGILNPPVIQQTGKDKHKIINGRKRVQIARENGWNLIHCHILNETLPASHVLTIHLEEQKLSGHLSPMEKAYFLHLCLQFIDINDVLKNYLPLLGYPAQSKYFKRLRGFLQLKKEIQISLHEQRTSEKTASALLELNENDRNYLGDLFVNFMMGKGKQQRLLSLCLELSRRNHTSIKTVLSDPTIVAILQHPEMNPPQKTNQLLELLQKYNLPLYHEAQKGFQVETKKLKLPKHCTLESSAAFEKDEVTLSIEFDNFDTCRKTWAKIRDYISN